MLGKANDSGIFEGSDGIYYAENGALKSGWVLDGEDYRYFDPVDYTAADGETEIDGITYTFEDCVLVKGAWSTDGNGTKYYWAGSPVTNKLITEDGETYFFGSDGYMVTGVAKATDTSWYLFGEDGKWMQSFSGIYDDNGFNYYIENGVSVYGDEPAGLCKVGDDYYYINTDGSLAKGGYTLVARTNGLMSYGSYYFDDEGRLVPPDQFKDGIVRDDDGSLYYYVQHKKVAAGWVVIDGATYYAGEGGLVKTGPAIMDGTVYYFGDDGKLLDGYQYTGLISDEEGNIYYVDKNNFSSGWKSDNGNYYYFDPETKKAVDGEQEIDGRTYTFADFVLYDGDWEVTENGTILYWAGRQAKNEFINAKGNTYYFNASGFMATGLTYIKVDGVGRIYAIDDNGVWLKDFSGFLTINDFTYFIEDGISVHGTNHAGLVKFNDDYYYINTSGQLIKDQFYGISKTNNLLPAGTYYFDADGKIDFDVEIKNGIYRDEEDGLLYYYVNGKKNYAGLL